MLRKRAPGSENEASECATHFSLRPAAQAHRLDHLKVLFNTVNLGSAQVERNK
jgi:hypothetical protein